jgi:hypothetical protein
MSASDVARRIGGERVPAAAAAAAAAVTPAPGLVVACASTTSGRLCTIGDVGPLRPPLLLFLEGSQDRLRDLPSSGALVDPLIVIQGRGNEQYDDEDNEEDKVERGDDGDESTNLVLGCFARERLQEADVDVSDDAANELNEWAWGKGGDAVLRSYTHVFGGCVDRAPLALHRSSRISLRASLSEKRSVQSMGGMVHKGGGEGVRKGRRYECDARQERTRRCARGSRGPEAGRPLPLCLAPSSSLSVLVSSSTLVVRVGRESSTRFLLHSLYRTLCTL